MAEGSFFAGIILLLLAALFAGLTITGGKVVGVLIVFALAVSAGWSLAFAYQAIR